MAEHEHEHDDGIPTDRAFGNGPRVAGGPVPAFSAVSGPGPTILLAHTDGDDEGAGDDKGGVDDDEDADDGVVRAKWLIDGSVTLADAADRLQGAAGRLRAMHEQGWTFTQPVEDDYGFLRKPDGPAVVTVTG